MFCSVKSGSIWGVEPYIVNIESDIQSGLPNFSMVGMLSSEVRESRERVRSSLKNCGYITQLSCFYNKGLNNLYSFNYLILK